MEGADWCDDANVSTAFSTQWQILYHAFQRQMQPKTSSCLPSCAHICEEWWILEDGLYDKVSITDKAMQSKQMFDRLLPLQRLWRHGTAIRSYASFIVSRSTRLSSIQVAARELTSLCMCVWMCLLLMLRVLASSSRQFRTYSVRAEALLLAQLHVKHEGVAEAVHTIKTERSALTFLFLNIHPFNLMNATQASKCRPRSERITEVERIALSIFC